MKRCFFLLLFSVLSLPLFSQSFTIPWKGTTVIDYGYEKFTVPYIDSEGFSYDGNNVWYSITQDYNGADKQVTGMNWERISATELHDIRRADLPEKDEYGTGRWTDRELGVEKIRVRIAAFKYENNTAYRLISFNITDAPASPSRTVTNRAVDRENPLKSGTFYKIKVDKSGVFKITTKFLRDNGINPSNINPRNFRIYGNGGLMLPEHNGDFRYPGLQQNAIQVIGEEDGKWDEGDYALFYAQGPNGYNVYNSSNGNGKRRTETRIDKPYNFINIYDDFAYYFINFDLGEGKRISDDDAATGGTLITRYDEYQYINEEKFNLLKIGRLWVGDAFNDSRQVKFTTRQPLKAEDDVYYRSRLFGFQAQGNSVVFTINGQNTSTGSVGSAENVVPVTYSGTKSGFQGNELVFNFAANTNSNPNGRFFLDYAEVQYKQDLTFNNSQLNFRSYEIDENNSNAYIFQIRDAASVEQVWDVSDITNVRRKLNKSTTPGTFAFGYQPGGPFVNEFVAFKNSEAFTPAFVGRVENQDLSGLQNVEYLMITVPEMMSQAQRLANMYQGKLVAEVVDVNKIYNEFSSGGKDITAIRDFVTHLHRSYGQLKYVFLLGDTSYDYKGKSHPGSDVIPSYQSEQSTNYSGSFVTDDYFVMTKTQAPTTKDIAGILPDLPIGRLPAANIGEAKLLIDKTLAYNNQLPGQSTPFGEWRMKLDFVVDDDADNGTPFHNTMERSLKTVFENGEHSEYNVRKLYFDAFPAQTTAGGQRYPAVNQAITNDMGNTMYLFYFGHGGINGWAQERVLTLDMIQNFNNYNNVYTRFPLVSTITCEFTLWDDPATFSAGEQVIKQKNGGAATMITSSRAIGVGFGETFSAKFTEQLFALGSDNDFRPLGDAFLIAKTKQGPNANHLKVNFLGDPAMKMSRPKKRIVVEEVISPVADTIRALDFVKIKGYINGDDGNINTSFSGRVAVNIFDKKVTKKTLNNDSDSRLNPVLEFKEEGSPIVKSSATVKDGKFTVEFYVPKDINYNVGDGRILMYADNGDFDVFSNQSYRVGGINPAGIDDKDPPKVKLYMNNTNFADGGITDQNPTLLACITDNTGINSAGSGIGHDVTAVLDGKVIDTMVLNDFFFSGDGNGCTDPALKDYQKGNVTYPLRNLTPGEHQLTFKVWDINNNSTTSTLNFIVKDEAERNLVMNKLLNWPNPFTNKTYIHFEHNCDDMLDVNVQIFTITGKLVKTISTMVTAEPFFQGYRTPRTAIEWDGTDDFGDTVGKGTYIFKVFARSQNQEKCRGGATGVEKMVLLK